MTTRRAWPALLTVLLAACSPTSLTPSGNASPGAAAPGNASSGSSSQATPVSGNAVVLKATFDGAPVTVNATPRLFTFGSGYGLVLSEVVKQVEVNHFDVMFSFNGNGKITASTPADSIVALPGTVHYKSAEYLVGGTKPVTTLTNSNGVLSGTMSFSVFKAGNGADTHAVKLEFNAPLSLATSS